ncbi:hypothetical protein KM043_015919 [Ampulex compressa]|nr:hypothetical protein KM043_015919 [Ampulex compressa]
MKQKIKRRAKGGLVAAVSRELGAVKVRAVNEGGIEIKEETLMQEQRMKKGQLEEENGKRRAKRRSKDRVINKDGRALLTGIKERGWSILNGRYEEEGNWTYIGENEASVIDYVIANEAARKEVKKVLQENRTESDHMPLEGEGIGRERREGVEIGEAVEGERSTWSEEGAKHYHEKCEGRCSKQTMTEDIWKEMVEKVKESVMKCKTKRKVWKTERRIWHSVQCKRRAYREWCKGERQSYEKEEEEKIKLIRTEKEVWKHINKYRKKKEGIDESILSERWRQHFLDLLDETSEKVILEERKETEEGEEKGTTLGRGEEEITKEELITQLVNMKRGKAPGKNGLENEAWRLMPKEIGEVVLQLINKIWRNLRGAI